MAIKNYVMDGVGPSSTIPYVVLDGMDIGGAPPVTNIFRPSALDGLSPSGPVGFNPSLAGAAQ